MASTPYERGGFRRTPRKAAATETAAPETEAADAREDATRGKDSQALADAPPANGRPTAQPRKEHQLGQMLHETEERTADLLYELTSVKKMDY